MVILFIAIKGHDVNGRPYHLRHGVEIPSGFAERITLDTGDTTRPIVSLPLYQHSPEGTIHTICREITEPGGPDAINEMRY